MTARRRPLGLPPGTLTAVGALAARPSMWRVALRQGRVLTPRRWWTRRPFLPLPDRDWMRFRLTTAYGDPAARLRVDDLLVWLAWSRTVRPGRETAALPAETRR